MKEEATDWKSLNHEMPEGWGKYLMLLCEAGGADNEVKILTRFQKVLRLIHDEQIKDSND